MAFDAVTCNVTTHCFGIALNDFALDVSTHGLGIMHVTMDFNIACLSLDMLYIACEFNLNDWTIGFVVLLKWLSVDENLTVNQFHA